MSDEQLVGVAEITQMFGVAKTTALRYTQRQDFPEPVGTLAAGRIWRRHEVEAWAKRHLPLPPGRPRRAGE